AFEQCVSECWRSRMRSARRRRGGKAASRLSSRRLFMCASVVVCSSAVRVQQPGGGGIPDLSCGAAALSSWQRNESQNGDRHRPRRPVSEQETLYPPWCGRQLEKIGARPGLCGTCMVHRGRRYSRSQRGERIPALDVCWQSIFHKASLV